MELLLVRHARPDIAPGICYGSADPASRDEDLARVHRSLLAAGLPGGAPVYASPKRLCIQLARLLAPHGFHTDARLAEMHFGEWEQRNWSDIPRAEVDAWTEDLVRYRPGGGETVLEVAQRVDAFLVELRQAAHSRALVVCHAGTMRLIAALHRGRPLEEAALLAAKTPHHIDYGQVMVLKD